MPVKNVFSVVTHESCVLRRTSSSVAWFRVSGFGFLISGFGFKVAGLGFGVLYFGFGFWVSGFGFPVSGFRLRALGLGFRISGFGLRVQASFPRSPSVPKRLHEFAGKWSVDKKTY